MTPQRAAELLPIITAFAQGKRIQCRGSTGKCWQDCTDPEWYDANQYRIAPEPRRVPLEASDWDGPVWWVRRTSNDEYLVYKFSPFGLCVLNNHYPFKDLMDEGWQRSRDRVTWTPCYKTVEESQ